MLAIVFIILQAGRVSWVVWTVAIVLFLAGVSMLIYFRKRLRKSEQEPEEDWTLSQRSLLSTAAPVQAVAPEARDLAADAEEIATTVDAPDQEAQPVGTSLLGSQSAPEPSTTVGLGSEATEAPPHPREREVVETQQLATPVTEEITSATEYVTALRETVSKESLAESPGSVPSEPRATEVLRSASPLPTAPAADEATLFDDDVWAEIEKSQQAAPLASQAAPPQVALPEATIGESPLPSARLDAPSSVAPLHLVSSERRSTFEPPTIEPLSVQEQEVVAPPTRSLDRPTTLTDRPGGDDREEPRSLPPTRIEEPRPLVAASHSVSLSPDRKVAGGVLGLPVGQLDKPLILGTPIRHQEDIGVVGFSGYGKDTDREGGRWGTITLGVVILAITASVLAYLFIPSFHTRVDGWLDRVRQFANRQPGQSAQPEPFKAQIFPVYKTEIVKEIAKARGTVVNISNETLSGLVIEIKLFKIGEAEPELRTVQLTPPELAPGQQGDYEFEYSIKQYNQYVISKLKSEAGEVKFSSPPRR